MNRVDNQRLRINIRQLNRNSVLHISNQTTRVVVQPFYREQIGIDLGDHLEVDNLYRGVNEAWDG